MSTEPAIEIDSLSKVYRDGWFRKRVDALKGVSFQVSRGEVFGLLGPNGAGKTTAIKILLGIVRKSEGTAKMLGLAAGNRLGRRQVGYLPENLLIPRHHTAYTALEYYGNLSGLPNHVIRERRDMLLEMVGLREWSRVSVKKYSKGMLQRLGIAQALLHEPELLILDEPTDGLDPVGRRQVRDLLGRLREEGKTVFLNSHLLQEVEMVCDRVAILDKGELKYEGTVDEITRRQQQTGARFEYQFDLVGDGHFVREVFKDRSVTSWQPVAANRAHVRARFADQADVDRCIDRLRSGGISIVGLAQHRVTLEDAFLGLLDDEEEAS